MMFKKTDDNEDRDSHGTIIASKAASRRYGLAKEVRRIQILYALQRTNNILTCQAEITPVKVKLVHEDFVNTIRGSF
jgi:hypothetical protein